MCDACGCHSADLNQNQTNEQDHDHVHDHVHGHTTGTAGSMNPLLDDKKHQTIMTNILDKNDREAEHIREHLNARGILGINLMSSPGSGKTSLLEKTAEVLSLRMAVLEGDLETSRDADRIRAKGVPAYQITTGRACHLDAFMVHHGLHHLDAGDIDLLFVENVGNLVCPASYDIGTHRNVVLLSVPEGDDKIAKYPVMFRKADLILISKWDLHEYFDFSFDRIQDDLKSLNVKSRVIKISIKDRASIDEWIAYLEESKKSILKDSKK